MKIKMLTDRSEHWTGGELDGKGINRPAGQVFTVGENDLKKVQPSNADIWVDRGWAEKVQKGAGPVTDIEGESDVN